MMLAPPDACLVTELADVVMINRYYGWYVAGGDLVAAEQMLQAELERWAEKHDKPILVTEYGADAMPGLHALRPVIWTEDYQAELLDTYHRVFDRIDAVVGRARVELRRLRDRSVLRPGGRQQEGRVHPRPAPEGRRPPPAPALAARTA